MAMYAARVADHEEALLRFELTAQFLDSEAQALAELLPLLSRAELTRVFGEDAERVRMRRLTDALRALRVALFEAGFSAVAA